MSPSPNEGTPLLDYALATVTLAAAEAELAMNWGWILAAGLISLLLGFLALASPVMASHVLVTVLSVCLLLVGVLNLTGLCFAEDGLKGPSALLGLVQVVLGGVIKRHKEASLMTLTIVIAIMFILDGLYRMAFAFKNRDIPGWKTFMFQGVIAVVLSIVILSLFPSSSLYTIGILVGVNFVTVGIGRIILSCIGRNIAINQLVGP